MRKKIPLTEEQENRTILQALLNDLQIRAKVAEKNYNKTGSNEYALEWATQQARVSALEWMLSQR